MHTTVLNSMHCNLQVIVEYYLGILLSRVVCRYRRCSVPFSVRSTNLDYGDDVERGSPALIELNKRI